MESRVHLSQERVIRFCDEPTLVEYLPKEELDIRTEHKKELWYLKSEISKMRKLDRDFLLAELRAITAIANAKVAAHRQNDSRNDMHTPESEQETPTGVSLPSAPIAGIPVQPSTTGLFCFRGLEIVMNKEDRDVTKKRAMETVLTEQGRHRNTKESTLPPPLDSRHEQDTQSSRVDRDEVDDEAVSSATTATPAASVEEFSTTCKDKELRHLEERISSRYKLATKTSQDEAYLRALKDAQDARIIFLESSPTHSP